MAPSLLHAARKVKAARVRGKRSISTWRKQSRGRDVDTRLAHFAEVERGLIEHPDTEFRFHSGVPEAMLR